MSKEILNYEIKDYMYYFDNVVDSTLNVKERERLLIEYCYNHSLTFQIKVEKGVTKSKIVNNLWQPTIFKYQFSKFKVIIISK